jgi:copper(I)-binding protein
MPRVFVAIALAMAVAGHALAQVTVHKPWARSTVPGQKVAGVFMTLGSSSSATLVRASSPASRAVEIHRTVMDGNVARMRPVPRLEIPARGSVELKPGGYHVMLIDIVKPLAPGDAVPLTLEFESGGKRQVVEIQAEVRSVAGGHGHAKH